MKLDYSLSQNISVSHNAGVILQKIMIEILRNYVRAHDLFEDKWLQEFEMTSRMLMKNLLTRLCDIWEKRIGHFF